MYNIILLIMDCARSKSIGCYDYKADFDLTPNIDSLAGKAVRYTNNYSPGTWTPVSNASIFTGLYPSEHGINGTKLFFNKFDYALSEILAQYRYETYGLFANAFFDSFFGFNRGFNYCPVLWDRVGGLWPVSQDVSEILIKSPGTLATLKRLGIPRFIYEYLTKGVINQIYRKNFTVRRNSTFSTNRILNRASRIYSDTKNPFFMCINLMQCHRDFNPPSTVRRRLNLKNSDVEQNPNKHFAGVLNIDLEEFDLLSKLYQGEHHYLDMKVGEFINSISKDKGKWDNTLFILTSDHGLHVGEKKMWPIPLFDVFFSVYNELVRVPLIIKYPKGVADQNDPTRLVQTHDIFATILDLLDIKNVYSGESSVSLLSSKKREYCISQLVNCDYQIESCGKINPRWEEEFPYWHQLGSPKTAIVDSNNMKYIFFDKNLEEIYDLSNDLYESRNLLRGESVTDFNIKESKRILEKLSTVTYTKHGTRNVKNA
ncbi:sulfatase [Chloroflexota bacterium]